MYFGHAATAETDFASLASADLLCDKINSRRKIVIMLLKSICSEGEYLLDTNATLLEAAETMWRNQKGAVVIASGKSIEGILSERDIVSLLSRNVDMRAKAINYATKHVTCVNVERSILHALIVMSENDIRRIVAVDNDNNFVSLISQRDLLNHIEDDAYKENLKIAHILDRYKALIKARYDMRILDALRLMDQHSISAIPVFSADDKPIGMISEKKVLELVCSRVSMDETVQTHMSSPLITVQLDTLVLDAVRLMNQKNIRRLMVIDEKYDVVSIITQKDIVKNFESNYQKVIASKFRHTKDLLDLLPELVLELLDHNSDQVIVWVNKRSIDAFGRKLIDLPIRSLIDEENWLSIYAALRENLVIEKSRAVIFDRIYEISGFYTSGEEASERGRIKLILHDITELEKRKETIENELAVYQRVIDSTVDIILLFSVDNGGIVIANEAAAKQLGYSKSDLLAKSIYEIDLDNKAKQNKEIRAISKDGAPIKTIKTYRKSNNEKLFVEIAATHVVMKSESFVMIVARDVAEKLALEAIAKQRNEELALFHNFINSLNRSNSIDEAYSVLTFYMTTLGIDAVHLYTINDLGLIDAERTASSLNVWERGCLERDIFACKAVFGGVRFVKNTRREFGCQLCSLDKRVKSYLCTGLYSSGKTIAIVSLISLKEGFFNDEFLHVLDDFFNAFSLLITNLRLIAVNRELSIHDPLTGLYNRRFLDEFLDKELMRVKANGGNCSLVMIDLDDFKRFNDEFGHEVGDIALKVVAQAIERPLRKGDIAVRYGGEEFLLVLPYTDKEGAIDIARAFQEKLEQTPVTTPGGGGLFITASLGISSMCEDGMVESVGLLNIADRRLYEAKRSGKNMVVS
ncbi:MAG: diguanylate cyclase [Helicobacteraceae bacterium]|nr:diguanylate cyclase [Helicobacteraceae bacterium]